jgi:hypothetical protein
MKRVNSPASLPDFILAAPSLVRPEERINWVRGDLVLAHRDRVDFVQELVLCLVLQACLLKLQVPASGIQIAIVKVVQ